MIVVFLIILTYFFIPMFNINVSHWTKCKCLLEHGFASVLAINYSLKLLDDLPVQTHKPYNNLHYKNLS